MRCCYCVVITAVAPPLLMLFFAVALFAVVAAVDDGVVGVGGALECVLFVGNGVGGSVGVVGGWSMMMV